MSGLYPVLWPGDGETVYLDRFVGESRNPLVNCPGYQVPAGLPLIVQLQEEAAVTSSSLRVGERAVEHCVFSRGATVYFVPRRPLQSETTYRVEIGLEDENVGWVFTVGDVLAPRVDIEKPASRTYRASRVTVFRGRADDRGSAGVASIEVALLKTSRTTGDLCRWWNGSRYVDRMCAIGPLWIVAEGADEWTYTTRTAFRRVRDGKTSWFQLLARGSDAFGNEESEFEAWDSVVFGVRG